ncbi:hypothetical protein RND71_030392 [Anisodus tanguticus]|uniref:Uncharacterized protein n=1 Tax=Anisodus tanguticus TaxID=243964 RepID=A0AAE1RH51_9SOLA|nr:hypothetical protein RND71_030392 [Anisodus tanguticus]
MAKFNEVQKKRRALISESKRARHGDPNTRKLKQKVQPLSISGKRKRKLFKKWRRDQKEAIEKGVITMEDVEIAMADAADGKTQDAKRTPVKFPMKKSSKLKLKKKGKKEQKEI